MCKSSIKRLKCYKCNNLFYEELVKPRYTRNNNEKYYVCPLCRGILNNYNGFDYNLLNNYRNYASKLKDNIRRELKAKYDNIKFNDDDDSLLYFNIGSWYFVIAIINDVFRINYFSEIVKHNFDFDYLESFEELFKYIDDVISEED